MSAPSVISCPLPNCAATWQTPELEVIPPGLADLFGMTPSGLAEMRLIQKARALEAEISRHMSKHPPEEWLPEMSRLAHRVAELEAMLDLNAAAKS